MTPQDRRDFVMTDSVVRPRLTENDCELLVWALQEAQESIAGKLESLEYELILALGGEDTLKQTEFLEKREAACSEMEERFEALEAKLAERRDRWRFEFTHLPTPQSDSYTESYVWVAISARGAMHIHIDHVKDFHGRVYEWYGGIETHSPTPLYDDQRPVADCQYLQGPCYCDGSSLYALETLIPAFHEMRHDKEALDAYMFEQCCKHGDARFYGGGSQ